MTDQENSNLVNLIRDQFETVNNTLRDIHIELKEHTEKDVKYWQKIDEQAAQLRLVKWAAGSGFIGVMANWLYQQFKH
jgi:RNA binding exosome subunit